jgi:hypothetical protein
VARPLAGQALSFIIAMTLVVACGGRTYVDGYPIAERTCADAQAEAWLCAGFTDFAVSTLDATTPDHAPVAAVETYRPDYRDANGGTILHTRGTAGGDAIVVLRLADDTVRAFYVGCFAGPWGEADRPPPDAVHCDLEKPMSGET